MQALDHAHATPGLQREGPGLGRPPQPLLERAGPPAWCPRPGLLLFGRVVTVSFWESVSSLLSHGTDRLCRGERGGVEGGMVQSAMEGDAFLLCGAWPVSGVPLFAYFPSQRKRAEGTPSDLCVISGLYLSPREFGKEGCVSSGKQAQKDGFDCR